MAANAWFVYRLCVELGKHNKLGLYIVMEMGQCKPGLYCARNFDSTIMSVFLLSIELGRHFFFLFFFFFFFLSSFFPKTVIDRPILEQLRLCVQNTGELS